MSTKHPGRQRIGLTSLAGSAALVAVGALIVALLAGASGAATTKAPKNTREPSITGVALEGQILQAKPGTWRPHPSSITYAYQWQRCGSTTLSCTTIPSATDAIYALGRADTGHTLRVIVTATSAGGSASALSGRTALVGPAPANAPVNTNRPTITGKLLKGSTLSAQAGTWTGNADSIRYSWRRCNEMGGSCASLAKTGKTYVLGQADVGHTIRVLVSEENSVGKSSALSTPTDVVGPITAPSTAPKNSSPPTISGTTRQGQTLTAATGSWSGTQPIRFSFAWRRCSSSGGSCASVRGANQQTYTLGTADVTHTVRVLVTATNGVGSSSAVSDTTNVVTAATPTTTAPKNTGEPSITGTPREGQRLTAKAGTWSGTQPITFVRRWLRCGVDGGKPDGSNCLPIPSATATSYVLQAADVGFRLRVRVTATNADGSATVASNATNVVTAAKPPSTAPKNTGEPSISGTTRVGQVLRTTRGSWTGTTPLKYAYGWFRCDGAGKADASNCPQISNANDASYVLRQADAGFRIRSQVTATNADGSATATSNPTAVIASAKPFNTTEPSISGSAVVGNTLNASRGAWGGQAPITYSFVWLRCSAKGDNCGEIPGATDNRYRLVTNDVGRTLRVRVIARNDAGSTSAISNETGVVGSNQPPPPPPGSSLAVGDLKAAGDRLVVSSVQFSPNPVRSRTAPITVRVRVTARGGRPVSGALVFVRGTPRVVTGQTQATQANGWVTLTLVPNQYFPQPRNGYNVQFFVKAYRKGDPALGGIAGYRLVQVPLAG